MATAVGSINNAVATAGAVAAGSATPEKPGQSPNQSALTQLNATFQQWGIDLGQWAWQKLVAGEDPTSILLDAEQTQQFQQRFPGMKKLQDAGVNITPGQYIQKERDDTALIRQYGLDTGTYATRDELGNLIGNQVSTSELQARLNTYQSAVLQAPQAARDYLANNYGINTGDLVGYWMNPNTSLPDLQMKAQAAQIGGQAATSGFGFLDAQQALNLAANGVTQSQAQSGFDKATHELQLTQNLGDGTGSISRNDLVNADLGGNGDAANELEAVASSRVARFQAGGGYAASQGGVSGLGLTNQGF